MRQSRGILVVAMCVFLTSAARICIAATFSCASGDMACLTNSILAANANGEVNVINLEAGFYTITTPYTIDPRVGGTAFPDITSVITIQEPLATQTVIARDPGASREFRIFRVRTTGDLTGRHVTIAGGYDPPCCGEGGGGILSAGRLTILDSILKGNDSYRGGGLWSLGMLRMHRSSVTENRADFGAGLLLGGEALITESAIIYNQNFISGAGGVFITAETVTIENSTIAHNSSVMVAVAC